MKKFLSLILAVLMLTLVFTACGKTDDAKYIEKKGELVVGMTLFAPMNYYDDDNNLVGFETEFANAIGEELGLKVKFQEIDWAAKETELASKAIDCIWNGMTITPERAEAMSISTPYMANKQVLVAKAENAAKYAADGVAGLKIVAETESAGEEVATTEAYFKDAKYTAVDKQATALMEVKSGTADACVVDYVASIGMIGEGTDYEDLVVVDTQDFSLEEYGIAFRKDSTMTAKVNDAIQKLADSGKLMEIAKKYKLDEQILVKAAK